MTSQQSEKSQQDQQDYDERQGTESSQWSGSQFDSLIGQQFSQFSSQSSYPGLQHQQHSLEMTKDALKAYFELNDRTVETTRRVGEAWLNTMLVQQSQQQIVAQVVPQVIQAVIPAVVRSIQNDPQLLRSIAQKAKQSSSK